MGIIGASSADRQEPSDTLALKATRLKEKLGKLKEEMEKLAAYEKQMLSLPDQQISLTDPDSRSLATRGRGPGVVSYNVQVAVDIEHHLIVAYEVRNTGSDRSQWANVAKQAKTVQQGEKLEVVADRGYFNGGEVLVCEEADITVTLPKADDDRCEGGGPFREARLVYLLDQDAYRPSGRASQISLHGPIAWTATASLLNERVPDLCHQGSMHHRQRAPDHAMGE